MQTAVALAGSLTHASVTGPASQLVTQDGMCGLLSDEVPPQRPGPKRAWSRRGLSRIFMVLQMICGWPGRLQRAPSSKREAVSCWCGRNCHLQGSCPGGLAGNWFRAVGVQVQLGRSLHFVVFLFFCVLNVVDDVAAPARGEVPPAVVFTIFFFFTGRPGEAPPLFARPAAP